MCSSEGEVRFKSGQARGGDIVPVEVVKDVHEDHHWEQAEVDFADEQCFELKTFMVGEMPEGAGGGGCFVVLAVDEGEECLSS